MSPTFHERSIVIDGLIISNFGREVFEDMRKGGLTAANCTCCVWEGFTQTMRNIMRWKGWFREHGDLIKQVYTTKDIIAAKAGRQGPASFSGGRMYPESRIRSDIWACSRNWV